MPLLLEVAFSKGWSAVSYSMEIHPPTCRNLGRLCRLWQRTARFAFLYLTRVHGCLVQRELGLLNHPVWFLVKRIIKYYSR